ncbi:hypothetical protein COZ82_01350 [Candidatus Kaiserbacteria bacterium CG_4_8_14_3_um_filter_38_9]|uniref:Uncharacterized protein n=1 Tax=Candidatus Kaiserbacteria bacterium CG_4_8_14_3_um_filter_38_9 TaxID=1974599 RepID=A0A2M7IPB7_9BACT|nr:MAG: hypothetical protein COZ82_01350 [Candidatus Kaiserbacteria bacterium CG_4_8_14_3_um_filter_38_9]
MRLWDAVLGLLAPNKYLHNRSLRDSGAQERQRHAINTALAMKAFEVAQKTGAAVNLRCTNSGWVELCVVPGDGKPTFTYNGRNINDPIELERSH